jgi:hypothetical protein
VKRATLVHHFGYFRFTELGVERLPRFASCCTQPHLVVTQQRRCSSVLEPIFVLLPNRQHQTAAARPLKAAVRRKRTAEVSYFRVPETEAKTSSYFLGTKQTENHEAFFLMMMMCDVRVLLLLQTPPCDDQQRFCSSDCCRCARPHPSIMSMNPPPATPCQCHWQCAIRKIQQNSTPK